MIILSRIASERKFRSDVKQLYSEKDEKGGGLVCSSWSLNSLLLGDGWSANGALEMRAKLRGVDGRRKCDGRPLRLLSA